MTTLGELKEQLKDSGLTVPAGESYDAALNLLKDNDNLLGAGQPSSDKSIFQVRTKSGAVFEGQRAAVAKDIFQFIIDGSIDTVDNATVAPIEEDVTTKDENESEGNTTDNEDKTPFWK